MKPASWGSSLPPSCSQETLRKSGFLGLAWPSPVCGVHWGGMEDTILSLTLKKMFFFRDNYLTLWLSGSDFLNMSKET